MDDETQDFEVVAMNPAAFYKGPADVLADAQLTQDQKLKLLAEWEQDLKRQLESDGEGMAQGVQGHGQMHEPNRSNDNALLGQVSTSLRQARDEAPVQTYPASKSTVLGRVWHRMFGQKAAA